jgi:hypothetical protein
VWERKQQNAGFCKELLMPEAKLFNNFENSELLKIQALIQASL